VEYVGRTLAVNDAQLRPQVEGYLLERKFEEGDDIDQGAELFNFDAELHQAGQSAPPARLMELDPIYANFSVSERDVIGAKRELQAKGSGNEGLSKLEVRLRLPDGSLYEHVGRLDFIDNVVDRKTSALVLRARFDNPDRLLLPGLYVSTMLGRQETTEKLVIPQAAIQEVQAGKFVLVVGPADKVKLRRITTGESHTGQIVVESGLNPDERVIVQGIHKVRPDIVVDAKLAPQPGADKKEEASQATATSGEKAAKTASGETEASKPVACADPAPTAIAGSRLRPRCRRSTGISTGEGQDPGVPLSDVFNTLASQTGKTYVNDFNKFGKTYQVLTQAEPQFRDDVDKINSFYTRNNDGDMVPLRTPLTTQPLFGPDQVRR
jgi:pyruvate/2-oxoglutarate dehydrogenase complex dihydrolipoamide acyltransferase (E2) component